MVNLLRRIGLNIVKIRIIRLVVVRRKRNRLRMNLRVGEVTLSLVYDKEKRKKKKKKMKKKMKNQFWLDRLVRWAEDQNKKCLREEHSWRDRSLTLVNNKNQVFFISKILIIRDKNHDQILRFYKDKNHQILGFYNLKKVIQTILVHNTINSKIKWIIQKVLVLHLNHLLQ